ncbi:MAG: M56 family metallopeptidase [Planctomycetota bacterium]
MSSPLAAGTLRPAIYLPPQVAQLPRVMIRSVLAHELAHHARLDPLWSRTAHGLVGCMYFQPVHRVARARIASSAELLADDAAVRWTDDAEGLARCLVEVAGWMRHGGSRAPGVPMVRATKRGDLAERIERAFDRRREPAAGLRWPLVILMGAAALLWLPSLKSAPNERSEHGSRVSAVTPYANALAQSVTALEDLASELRGSGAHELRTRLRELQQEAEAIGALVESSPQATE